MIYPDADDLVLIEWFATWSQDPTAHYEDEAERFYRDTGMMAPGKSEPPDFSTHTMEERYTAWRAWCLGRNAAKDAATLRLVAWARGVE